MRPTTQNRHAQKKTQSHNKSRKPFKFKFKFICEVQMFTLLTPIYRKSERRSDKVSKQAKEINKEVAT